MNKEKIETLMEKSLAGEITFPEILEILVKEGIESYHVDFLRDEVRYYAANGESLVKSIPFVHDEVAPTFSPEKLDAINKLVQSRQATFADFVRNAPAVGCAYYIVHLKGKKVRYFGRNDGEHVQYLPGSIATTVEQGKGSIGGMSRSVIKFVDIAAPFETVFDFMADPLNWPRYAIVNMKSVKPGTDGWFDTVTKFGKGQIKVSANKETGIFDHVWRDPQASWTVPARVVPNHDGATVMLTIFKPSIMTDQQFDDAMREMDQEMSKLKAILESES